MNTSLRFNRRRLVSFCVLLAWTMASSPGVASASQATPTASGGSHTTSAGSEVTWTAPWAFNDERSIIDDSDQVQMLQFEHDTAVTLVAQGDIPDIEEAVELFQGYVGGDPEARETIDGGAGDPVSYWLDLIPVNGEPHGSFSLARTSDDAVVTMTLFLAPVDTFADGFASAQASIAIDGVPVFDGVEGAGLQELLAAATPAEEAADDRENGSKLGGDDAPAETESWTDPNHGYEVTWSEAWVSSVRNEATLVLVTTDDSVVMNLTGAPANGATTAGLAEVLPGRLAEVGVEVGPAGIAMDADSLILAGELDGSPVITEVLLVDGGATLISTTVIVSADVDLDDAIAFYRDSVLIAGVAPLDGWESITL